MAHLNNPVPSYRNNGPFRMPPIQRLLMFLFKSVQTSLSILATDVLFFFTAISVFLKSVFFLGLINNDGVTFTWLKTFHSYGAPPPIPIYIAFGLAFLSFTFLLRGRKHFWCLLGLNIVFSLLLITDLISYRGSAGFLSPALFIHHPNLFHDFSRAIPLLRLPDLVFVLDLILILLIGLKTRKLYAQTGRSVLLFLLFISIPVLYIDHAHYERDIKGNNPDRTLFMVKWVPNQTMCNLSPIGYHLYDLYNYYIANRPYKLSGQEQTEIKNWFAAKQENLPPAATHGVFAGQNLIFIQVESLEYTVLNHTVDGQEITPNLNKLLQNSLNFNNFYEQVYNGTSSDADLLANTSLYPVRQGMTFFRFPTDTYNALPKLLADKGYLTLAAHPDKGYYWNRMPVLASMGFQKTIDANAFKMDEIIGLGLSDGSFYRQTIPILKQQKQPFYAYLITLTSHGPFDLPDKYKQLKLDKSLDQSILGAYFQSIHYADQQIGSFMNQLDKAGILANSVVVIYGDHTGVHKYYEDQIKALPHPEKWWLDDSKRIPLIIYHQGMRGRDINTTGGEIDIMPTVTDLMGIAADKYQNTVLGRNLLNTKKDFAVLESGEYVGKAASPQDQAQALQGIDISDKIIRSNYFRVFSSSR